MGKLFESIKEFTYDFIGYVLPGSIVTYLMIISIKNNMNSPMYILFKDISQYNEVLTFMTNINIIAILVVSYIIGHGISFLSVYIEVIVKLIIKAIINIKNKHKSKEITSNSKDYMEAIKEVVLEKYSDDEVVGLLGNREALAYLKRKASTLSRFESHNDLIQKYIYKSKLYGSMSSIFIVLMIDSIISTCIFIIRTKKNIEFTKLTLCIGVILFTSILAIGFYKEYIRHNKLREKEEYMYLINRLS
ncbi:hypothetical protein [Paraclostridium sordellii]|uniref:hypothetical protein n=1 Tax=Paraclostridium sordellii TaxID=1505 RepID=UPI0005E189A7|nr:hypothetical protein [Paeniclostridium sordellii]CEO26286.1 Uncharacterised protein [[Clostridium] sordellii] [Paeniclostridium sordellii]